MADDEKESAWQPAPILELDDAKQLELLSNTLRQRILEQLVEEPRTTKQVADLLGEKPTRLYHHVDKLHNAGFLRLVRTQPKRGTVERYFQTVARAFRVSEEALGGQLTGNRQAASEVAAQALEMAAQELRAVPVEEATEVLGIAGSVLIRLDAKRMLRYRKRLEKLLADLQADESEPEDPEEARFVFAWYPKLP